MNQIHPDENLFRNLADKVVVLTGGSSGIGAATTTLLYQHGAHVVFGDTNQEAAENLIKALESSGKAPSGTATFVPCNVTRYSDIFGLFKTALERHGKVDHAVSCAGIVDDPKVSYFDPELDVTTVGQMEGSTSTLDVNLLGTCSFARIALPFLRHGKDKSTMEDCSLTFLSSVTGFRDAPGMFLYQTSKQSVLGLMRSMRIAIRQRDNIRVNAICPGMTESALTEGFIDLFRNNKSQLPAHYQTSMDVAKHIAAVTLATDINGESIYVEEGRGWTFEAGLAREMTRWLGEEPARLSDENLKFIESLGGL